jgi:hypothetical protein
MSNKCKTKITFFNFLKYELTLYLESNDFQHSEKNAIYIQIRSLVIIIHRET